MEYTGKTGEYLKLVVITANNCHVLQEIVESSLTLLWFENDHNEMTIDSVDYIFQKNQIIALTEFHQVTIKKIFRAKLLRFNRPFYCILDHDEEVSCKGILFFGASQLPIITIPEEELEVLETVWKMFQLEMKATDKLQLEMLQMMLKRYLILCTRLYKKQAPFPTDDVEIDIVRQFNFLVEKHFKSLHTVSEYAQLLNKSPKTLSNIFSKSGNKTPLQFIQERKLLEAKRLLNHSDLQVKEIAYEIGYEEVQAFSRFFKKQVGVSPVAFRNAE